MSMDEQCGEIHNINYRNPTHKSTNKNQSKLFISQNISTIVIRQKVEMNPEAKLASLVPESTIVFDKNRTFNDDSQDFDKPGT